MLHIGSKKIVSMFQKSDTYYKINFPKKGGQYDYDMFVKTSIGVNDDTKLATCKQILRHRTTNRPIMGKMKVFPYGDQAFDTMGKAVDVFVHELGNAIAFSAKGFKDYQKNFITLAKDLSGYMWTGPKVLEKARSFYGCSTLEGVPLKTVGAEFDPHWSEDFFLDELMTPKTGPVSFVSAMTLALCEDTGWYKANYDMVENFTYMKGKGCKAVKDSLGPLKCPKKPKPQNPIRAIQVIQAKLYSF